MENQKQATIDKQPLYDILESAGSITSTELIPLLQKIQGVYGYLPPQVLTELSKKTRIPIAKIFGVATFYEQFHLKPHGKFTVKCCRGTACHVKGGPSIIKSISEILRIEPGETTEDMLFTFETVACLGTCFLAPVMMIEDQYYGHLTADKIKTILQSYSKK